MRTTPYALMIDLDLPLLFRSASGISACQPLALGAVALAERHKACLPKRVFLNFNE